MWISIHRYMGTLRTATAARIYMTIRWFVLVSIFAFTIYVRINFIEFAEMLCETHVVIFFSLVELSWLSASECSKMGGIVRNCYKSFVFLIDFIHFSFDLFGVVVSCLSFDSRGGNQTGRLLRH